ncbi:MAG: hypothetical protein AAFP93_02410 [Bacteroidota bacterium]
MKKLTAFLIIFLLVLVSATYLYYSHWRNEYRATVAMPHVPASAALVCEAKDIGKQWRDFQRTAIAQNLQQLPCFTALQRIFCFGQALAGSDGILNGLPLIVSVHSLGEEQVGYLCYLSTHHTATQKLIEKLLFRISKDKSYRKGIRKYHNYNIFEISNDSTQQHLFYLKQGSYLVVSTSSLLMEEVTQSLAGQALVKPLQLKKSTSKQGALHINFDQLPQLLRVYLRNDVVPLASPTWAKAGLLTLQFADHHLSLSGYITGQSATEPKFIGALSGQEPGSIEVGPYIPQNTALLRHYTFSNPGALLVALQRYQHTPSSLASRQSFQGMATTLDPLLAGEIAHCFLETKKNASRTQQLMLLRTSNAEELTAILESARVISPFSAKSSNSFTPIYTVTPKALQAWLPCQLCKGFIARYLASVDDYIVLFNSQQAFQTWTKQYRQKQTWMYHAARNAWLASTLDQAHVRYFVDVQKSWPQLVQMLKPTWRQAVATHTQALQQLARGSVQLLCGQENGCYVNLMLRHKRATTVSTHTTFPTLKSSTDCLTIRSTFQAGESILAGPFLVKSHRTKSHYTLLQDTQHQLCFLDPSGKLLWKRALEGPIVTPVFEIDFFKNNKVQYLLATDKKLHLLDYYGRKVARYPQPLPTSKHPMQLNVIDYNKSKNYRFLLATAWGDIYLYDKHYRLLAGWKPRSLKKSFTGAPFHLRVRGNDYFVALQDSGDVHILNRRGDYWPGFPINLGAKALSPLWVKKGINTTQTQLTALIAGGHQLTFNLSGTLEKRLLLPQASETPLILCPERLAGKQYVLVRPGEQSMAVLDQTGELIFQKSYGTHQLQYYVTHGKQLYVSINVDKRLAYFYDDKGQPLRTSPLPSDRIAIVRNPKTKKLTVCNCYDQQCCHYVLDY